MSNAGKAMENAIRVEMWIGRAVASVVGVSVAGAVYGIYCLFRLVVSL